MLPPPSPASELAPPPLEVLPHTPSLARRDVLLWAIALRGSQSPAPSVRGLGGAQTLGMHDGIGGSLGGLLEGIRPRAAKAGRWRWMDGRRGKMVIAIGEVVVAS